MGMVRKEGETLDTRFVYNRLSVHHEFNHFGSFACYETGTLLTSALNAAVNTSSSKFNIVSVPLSPFLYGHSALSFQLGPVVLPL